MAGQSVCSGWGSLSISCCRESLFTNVTWLPAETTISFGLTPLEVIVMVLVGTGVVVGDVGDGELDDDPPPQASAAAAEATSPRRTTLISTTSSYLFSLTVFLHA